MAKATAEPAAARIEELVCDDVAALVSDHEGHGRVRSSRANLSTHEQVVETARTAGLGTVLPMRFGVVMPDRDELLARILATLNDMQAPTNAHWSSFRMTQRLLEKHSRIPVAMFHAVYPFLQDILALESRCAAAGFASRRRPRAPPTAPECADC